jgi:hypothetical protein
MREQPRVSSHNPLVSRPTWKTPRRSASQDVAVTGTTPSQSIQTVGNFLEGAIELGFSRVARPKPTALGMMALYSRKNVGPGKYSTQNSTTSNLEERWKCGEFRE